MNWLSPITLRGYHASLLPLSHDHHDDLVEAVRDGELWNLWYTSVPAPGCVHEEIERRLSLLNQNAILPFAVIENATNQAVGMTNYLNVDSQNRRVEIGGTWYRRRVQRTGINTECKLLLLRHAFESLNCIAVEFRTHFFNQGSRRAIERLGAKLDGVLRNHLIVANGTMRDTCVYSIVASEWPAVKTHLSWLLKAAESRNE